MGYSAIHYLYTREPGGNRIEICSGGYLGFDPDDNPVVWTADEYAAKPGWGARLPSTFRTYGTPRWALPRSRSPPALTYRDANAAPVLELLDLRRPAFATPPKLAQPLAVTDPSALTCSTTGPGTIPPPSSVTG